MKLIGCTGCKACEAVCGYHHSGEFCPAKSSIVIQPDGDGFSVDIYFGTPPEGHTVCDRCAGLDERLCIKYCSKIKGRDALSAFHDRLDEGGNAHDKD